MRVFILLFNAGTDNEGIHTVHAAGRDKVLMFAEEDDATRFALLLEAQDFPAPTVEAIDSREIEAFCEETGYDWELIEQGMLAIPPAANVEEIDWQKEQKKTDDSEMSAQELEKIRRRLEGLL
jgi:hypothetical protein